MHTTARIRTILTLLFSACLLLGITVCTICNLALDGALTWARYPIVSIVFAWLICAPLIQRGRRGLIGSLAALSICLIPYLYALSGFLGDSGLLTAIGVPVSLLSIAYLWCVYLLFRRLRPYLAAAVTTLLLIPLSLGINWIVSRYAAGPVFDVWDLISAGILFLCAGAFFLADAVGRTKA